MCNNKQKGIEVNLILQVNKEEPLKYGGYLL